MWWLCLLIPIWAWQISNTSAWILCSCSLNINLHNKEVIWNPKDTWSQRFFSSWYSVTYPMRTVGSNVLFLFSEMSFAEAFRILLCSHYPTHSQFILPASQMFKCIAHSSNRYFPFPEMPLLLACTSITWAFCHPKPIAHGLRKELERSSCLFPWGCLPSACATCLTLMQMPNESLFWWCSKHLYLSLSMWVRALMSFQ